MSAKKLGFGMMRLPLTDKNDASSIDIEQTKRMVDAFIAGGFTYFDTAWMYCSHKSEDAVKTALVDRHPRDSFTLATKLHSGYIETKEDRDRIFNEQLRKTGAGYFDYYLIHDVNRGDYDKYLRLECFEWLREKKKAGLVKNIGFSFHDGADFLEKVLNEQKGLDFVQLQINYLDWDSDGVQSRKCYECATAHGLPVVVMEPVKGGTLAKVPEAAEKMFRAHAPDMSVPSWAIRFAAGLDNVMMVLSGMSNMEQLEDNMSYMSDPVPLDSEEQAIVRSAVNIINGSVAVPCTGCAYCVEGCPMNIPIPKYFSLYNADLQETDEKGWKPQGEYYDNLTKDHGKAGDCIGCGQCEGICPQHLHIIDGMKTVAEYFGK